MNLFSATYGQIILLAVCVLCFVALNAVALMISLFYRKKLRKSSPRWGFIVAIIMAAVCCTFLFGAKNGASLFYNGARVALAVSAVASMYSTANLFFIMRRVRK
jgi:drug/metabolite transporter (DMT)-like permease